jgi:hypothetical protein
MQADEVEVTSVAEDIATQIVATYKLDVDRLVWLEHYCYPDEGHKFDPVRFRSDALFHQEYSEPTGDSV